MSSELLLDESEFIKKLAKNNDFVDFTIDVDSGSNLGENYTSTINKVIVKEKGRQLNLIVKSLMVNIEDPTDWLAEFFERETYTYEKVLPSLRTQLDKNRTFLEYPKYYGILEKNQKKSMFLEDMRSKGYKLFNRHEVMTQKYFTKIFQTYGKLHANSYALKINDPTKFKEIGDKVGPPHLGYLFLEHANLFEAILVAVEDDKSLYDHVKNRRPSLENYFQSITAADDKYNVLIHGDNWCNNFLFKYENDDDTQNITDICLLDWQLTAVGSPICDLSYTFYVNARDGQLRNLNQLLVEYHKSFHETLNHTDEIISLEEIRNQWKIHSVYGLIATTLVQQVMMVDGSNAPNITDKNNTDNIVDILLSVKSDKSEYNRRLKDIIKFMYENDFL